MNEKKWVMSDEYKALAADISAALMDRDAALRRAEERPRWCSPVRWRIELSRRRDARRFDALPDVPIHRALVKPRRGEVAL